MMRKRKEKAQGGGDETEGNGEDTSQEK